MAFRFRYPNKGCFSGNYCCTTCIYFCFVDGRCGTPKLDSIQLCSTDGLTYTGSDAVTGASATATYSAASGWSVSYSCPGSSGSHGWGAGNNLPLVYEDPSATGWYVALSATPSACNSSGLAIDCFNCIVVSPAITRTLFATLTGWSLCGVNFDGTYALTFSGGSSWDYTGPIVAANPTVCTSCGGGTCSLQLGLHLQCAKGSSGIQYDWTNQINGNPSGSNPCYAAPNTFPCPGGGVGKTDTGAVTRTYSSNYGACNFSLTTSNGVTFHL